MRARSLVLSATAGVCLLVSFPAHAQRRCVAGELALPADGVWTTTPAPKLPAGRTGCLALRMMPPGEIASLVLMRATPKGTGAVSDAPHPRLLVEVIARLAEMNLRVTEPKWRKLNVPFSGLEGFGNATMFGFDGMAIGTGLDSDVVVLVFDGPSSHYDVTLIGEAEKTAPVEWKQSTAAFMALLNGLDKAPASPAR